MKLPIVMAALVAAAGCKKSDDSKSGSGTATATASGSASASASASAGSASAATPPASAHKGVPPVAMPPAPTLTPDEQKLSDEAAPKTGSDLNQYGVPRGGVEGEELRARLDAAPKALAALLWNKDPGVQLSAAQALFSGTTDTKPLVWDASWNPAIAALMTGSNEVVAASVTTSAASSTHDPKSDEYFLQLLQQQCRDDVRVSVRGAACAGVIDSLSTELTNHPDAMETVGKALADEDPYVVMRTLDVLANVRIDSKYEDAILAALKSPEPVVRGLGASCAYRATKTAAGDDDPAADKKAHDALVPALSDPDPYVKCEAAWGLYNVSEGWDWIDPAAALLDDKAKPEASQKYQQQWLTGAKEDTWGEHASYDSVGSCALEVLLRKAGDADPPLAFEAKDEADKMSAGRAAFTAWWKTNGDKLKAH